MIPARADLRSWLPWIVILIAILAAAAFWLGSRLSTAKETAALSPYSVVVMSNGEILFGKLNWSWEGPKLSETWALNRSLDQNNQPQVSVVPIQNAAWDPATEVNLNRAEMIYWSRLRADSEVAKTMADPDAANLLSPANPPAENVPVEPAPPTP